jgi:AcrR family transcriptional regulator
MTETTNGTMSRQREVGAASRRETRRRLLVAAGEEFAANGYANATVNRIAQRAGVTLQTLYLAWGSKRALLRAYMESTLASTAGPPDRIGDRFAGMPAHEVIAGLAALVGEIANRSAVGWKLYRDGAAIDPEIARDWAELQSLRRETFARVVRAIPKAALRPGLSHEDAGDTAWAIASPDLYDVLVRHGGYSADRFEEWVASTLAAALLA